MKEKNNKRVFQMNEKTSGNQVLQQKSYQREKQQTETRVSDNIKIKWTTIIQNQKSE